MTVNSYFAGLASSAIIRDDEQLSIRRSIANLQGKLANEFHGELANHFIFGSYSRGTILPRFMDERSDIDYMIVFKDGSLKPQSYLSRLRRFVERNYTRSEIYQSNPTVVLALNHINFELVPAIENWMWGLHIPAKASDYNDWIATNPADFNQRLVDANRDHKNLIKPVVRLLKYWNAKNGYVFDSYELERKIAEGPYIFLGWLFGNSTLQDYLYEAVNNLELPWGAPQWKHERLTRAKSLVSKAKGFQSYGGYEHLAQREIERLLPAVNALSGLLGGFR